MTTQHLPDIVIDRRKLTCVLGLHIKRDLLIAHYSREDIAQMVEEYCTTENEVVEAVVAGLFRTIPRMNMQAIQQRLIEPTVGDLQRLRGATHYTIQVASNAPEAVKSNLHTYLTSLGKDDSQ